MIDAKSTAIRCENAQCARKGEPFAFLYLGAGDIARVVCPTCGWISTVRVGQDGRHRLECQVGAEPPTKRPAIPESRTTRGAPAHRARGRANK